MFSGHYFEDEDMGTGYGARRANRRFDEYLRCYPVVMMPGAERVELNYGGKVIMPPSALDKLTRLHIAYPMLFELRNPQKETVTHAGVLEFIADEGRVYLPHWMMDTLQLEPGELLQLKSTDLPLGSFIKLQPQSVSFLTCITDPKAVLENALGTFSALTRGDVFSFSYNEQVFQIAVLEVRPASESGAISCIETDLEVDFAPPVGYVEPERASSRRPGSGVGRAGGGVGGAGAGAGVGGGGRNLVPLGEAGSMAKAIGYAAIAPASTPAATAKHTFFTAGGGQRLKGSKSSTPKGKPSTPVAGASSNTPPPPPLALPPPPPPTVRRGDGPQPLRLPPGKLFFGYEIKPVKKAGDEQASAKETTFSGAGNTLRGGSASGKKRKGDEGSKASKASKGKNSKSDIIEID